MIRQHDPQDAREIRVTFWAIVGSIFASCVCIGIAVLIVIATAYGFLGSEP